MPSRNQTQPDRQTIAPFRGKITASFRRMPTLQLTAAIIFAAVFVTWIADNLIGRYVADPYRYLADQLVGTFLFFALGWVGVINAIRKEFYQVLPWPIRGRIAVVVGISVAAGCWLMSLRLLWNAVQEIARVTAARMYW